MLRIVLVVALALFALDAQAEGFASRDLTGVAADARAALGETFQHRADPQRVTLMCPSCEGAPMVDMLIGRQTDGTEQRVRSGQTSFARLEEICRQRSPTCRLEPLKVAPAVGWITSYPLGSTFGSTAVIIRDGDLLTIRSLSSDAATARSNAKKLVGRVAPKVVGP